MEISTNNKETSEEIQRWVLRGSILQEIPGEIHVDNWWNFLELLGKDFAETLLENPESKKKSTKKNLERNS